VIELADMIAVNKADANERAAASAADYRAALHILAPASPLWSPPVILVSGLAETGLDELWAKVLDHRGKLEATGELAAKRRRQDSKWMWALVDERIREKLKTDVALREKVPAIEQAVAEARLSPAAAADEIAALLGL
jgi:LAO/AO transport system kinase